MKNYSEIFIIFFCIAFLFAAGCVSETDKPVSTTIPTTSIPTTVIPTTSITPEITEIQNVTPNETVTSVPILPTLSPKADSTDVSEIGLTHFAPKDP